MAKRSWADVDMAAAVASSTSIPAFLAVAFPTVGSLSSAPAAAAATATQAAAADAAAAAAASRVATLRAAAGARLAGTRTKLDAAIAAVAELDAAAEAAAERDAAAADAAAAAAAAEAQLAALTAVRAVGDAHGRVVEALLGRGGGAVAAARRRPPRTRGGWCRLVAGRRRRRRHPRALRKSPTSSPRGVGGGGAPDAPPVPSWAAAALLRAPLARFKYHFLGAGRSADAAAAAAAGSTLGGTRDAASAGLGMDRVDRPEWAAEYALARLAEAGPLLSRLALRFPYVPVGGAAGPPAGVPATLAAADAYARVYAAKVGDDVAAVAGEAGADALVLHAADAAAAFDASLVAGLGAAATGGGGGVGAHPPPAPSALAYLVADRPFFGAWTGAAVRVALPRVLSALAAAMAAPADGGGTGGGVDDGDPDDEGGGGEELSAPEAAVAATLRAVTAASATSRGMARVAGAAAFVRRVELPLLAAVREELGGSGDAVEAAAALGGGPEAARAGAAAVATACRSAYVATRLADAIVDRADSLFYIRLAEAAAAAVAAGAAARGGGDGAPPNPTAASAPGGIFEEDVLLLRATAASLTASVGSLLDDAFRSATRAYGASLRSLPGPTSAAAAAVAAAVKAGAAGGGAVALPPPSPDLAAALGGTAHLLAAIPPAAVDRSVAAGAWRPAARAVGGWFPALLLRAATPFPGRGGWGRRARAAAGGAAGGGAPAAAAAMQAAADAAAVVAVWAAVTTRPGVAVRRVEEAGRVLRLGGKVAVAGGRTLGGGGGGGGGRTSSACWLPTLGRAAGSSARTTPRRCTACSKTALASCRWAGVRRSNCWRWRGWCRPRWRDAGHRGSGDLRWGRTGAAEAPGASFGRSLARRFVLQLHE
ncbi:hypothetical protein BU14_0014s0084 [Porphyra umbilicalis]|uniref:Uncharacterized protein n=1 Tax=Porphyra umbilicalis TaxID=2786 RepID=A0A1X6PKU3_PORUM|nr:hypothetical protein BU14_0014s0084 [Porphyra umbilicalis]|eukprot:OSX81534.1 hypothetical protein BU14_0014s0084 [Porphyra umbilicalis]